jgi:hypothetical protein
MFVLAVPPIPTPFHISIVSFPPVPLHSRHRCASKTSTVSVRDEKMSAYLTAGLVDSPRVATVSTACQQAPGPGGRDPRETGTVQMAARCCRRRLPATAASPPLPPSRGNTARWPAASGTRGRSYEERSSRDCSVLLPLPSHAGRLHNAVIHSARVFWCAAFHQQAPRHTQTLHSAFS